MTTLNNSSLESPDFTIDLKLFLNMLRIRVVEEELARVYPEWQIRCPVHFCIGQEAPPTGVIEALMPEDTVLSHHRAHGHYLSKGGDLKRMVSELYGRMNGCSSGRGGSMHLIDLSVNFLGSSSIVSGTIPVALGVGFSLKRAGNKAVSTVFFGDGATEEGGFYESLNFAALHKLPILFVCENNYYSVYTKLSDRRPKGSDILKIAKAMNVKSAKVDGNNVRSIHDTTKKALNYIRCGKGPFLIEASTYRWLEHCGPFRDDDLNYRASNELDKWVKRDPVAQMKKKLLADGHASEKFIDSEEEKYLVEVRNAISFAKTSQFPSPNQLALHVYSDVKPEPCEPAPTDRLISFKEAIREATEIAMERDDKVYVVGLGATDPKRIFNTTSGLVEKFGADRFIDGPVSETAMTGLAIGSAITGLRPILSHQRSDFSLMAMDQLINNAAKWRFMFGGSSSCPILVRMLVGRGWGQGPQHSQNFQAMMAHIPGLKVVAPSTAFEAKGLFLACMEENDPYIFIEQRWLHDNKSYVPEGYYTLPLGKAEIIREGTDITIVGAMDTVIDALRASDIIDEHGISVEIINLRTIKPMDEQTVINSVNKTGRLLVVDPGWQTFGVSAEILAFVAESSLLKLKPNVRRIGLPDIPSPSSPALTKGFYLSATAICRAVGEMMETRINTDTLKMVDEAHDTPNKNFVGPF